MLDRSSSSSAASGCFHSASSRVLSFSVFCRGLVYLTSSFMNLVIPSYNPLVSVFASPPYVTELTIVIRLLPEVT
jgi:hypothetical protein